MKIKVHTIDFEFPRRLKRALVYVGIPALLFLGLITVVQADTLTIPDYTDGDPLSAATMNDNFAAIEDAVNTLVPVGTIVAYYGTSAPSGWLIANRITIDKSVNTDYTALVDHLRALNTDQGIDNPADTNQAVLPDLRGQFLRGQDKEAGVNPDCGDDLIGQVQNDASASHNHVLNDPGHSHYTTFDNGGSACGGLSHSAPDCYSSTVLGSSMVPPIIVNSSTGITIDSSGGNETRPTNVTILYIIKY